MREQRVVRVGAVAGKVKRPAVTARGLAEVLDVDAGPLERAIREGGKQQFVDAIVMRPRDYRPLRAQIEARPRRRDRRGDRDARPEPRVRPSAARQPSLPPPRSSSRSSAAASRPARPWASGACRRASSRGSRRCPERRVVIREEGVPVETLLTRGGRRGRAVATTLDRRVQAAAEEALAGTTDEAALVAVQPSTGDVLAVANRPVESTYNRALEGTYAPGSTFKVVSTAALLRDGLDVGDTVQLPAHDRGRRAAVQELRGRRRRARSRSAATSRCPATPPSSRSRRASRPTR